LNDFVSKVFIAIAIGGLVFGLSLFLAMMIYPQKIPMATKNK